MYKGQKNMWEEKNGVFTASEIEQQPETWLKTFDIISKQADTIKTFIDEVVKQDDFDVIFTGAGTSEFVGHSITPLLTELLDYKVRTIGTTDIVATPKLFIDDTRPTLLVSFGRSGNSPESIGAVDIVNEINPNAKHLVITCNHEGKLALREESNILAIILPEETNDKSLAMTSSYTNMYLAALLALNVDHLDSLLVGLKDTVQAAEDLLNEGYKEVVKLVEDYNFSRIVYLADGGLTGVAQEGSLKMLELTAGNVVTMFNTPLGFRHGPKSFINDETLTVVMMSEDEYTRPYQIDLIKQVASQRSGDQVVVIDVKHDQEIADVVNKYFVIDYKDTPNANFIGLNMTLYVQLLSLYKSVDLDIEPDSPSPSGQIHRVVEGVTLYPYTKKQ